MEIKELFLANVKKYIRPQTDPVAVKLVFDDTTGARGRESCPWKSTAIR